MIISNNSLQRQIETAEYKHHKSLMTKILGKFLKVDTESWAKFWGEKKQISFMQYLEALGIKDNQGFLAEKDIEKLEQIVAKLEEENLSIDEGLTLYAEAIKLGKKLVEEIKESKGKLELLNQDLTRINLEDCEVE